MIAKTDFVLVQLEMEALKSRGSRSQIQMATTAISLGLMNWVPPGYKARARAGWSYGPLEQPS